MVKQKSKEKKTIKKKTRRKSSWQKNLDIIKNIKFKGNFLILISFMLVGILIPPFLSFAIIYFLYRCFPEKPRLFDKNLLIYSLTLFLIWSASLHVQGMGLENIFAKTAFGTLLLIIFTYPFVYAWLWFDYNYSDS